jgi:hypothetical protein
MNDPLSEVITLLQPRAVFSRRISGAGRWGVRYSAFGRPSFCAVLEGSCRLTVDGHRPLTLEAGDFVLLPATPGFTMSGFEPVRLERFDPMVTSKVQGEVRHGTRGGRPDVRLLGGWFEFDSPDSVLLVSLLPPLVHVRGVERLSILVRLVGEEANERRAGRDLVLTRLVEVLLIEALRAAPGDDAPPGLLRGLADARLAPAIRQMHSQLERSWTVALLARTAALSRSAFFERPRALSACHRWNTYSPGGWRSRRMCSAGRTSGLPRSPNASATPRRVPSAPRSADTWAALRVATHARPGSARQSDGDLPRQVQRLRRPAPADRRLARRDLRSIRVLDARPSNMWTPAHASKAARTNRSPASLSAKRTAAFGPALRERGPSPFGANLQGWQGQFQGQRGDSRRARKSRSRLYLGFSPR